MITVFKYTICLDEPRLLLPKSAQLLTVGAQGNKFCLWAKVDSEADLEERNFHVFGTGHEIPRNMGSDFDYIGTVFMHNDLVFHIFERLGL